MYYNFAFGAFARRIYNPAKNGEKGNNISLHINIISLNIILFLSVQIYITLRPINRISLLHYFNSVIFSII